MDRDFALQGAIAQDSLLQSYRKLFHLIMLGLLGLGTLLAISSVLTNGSIYQILFSISLLITFASNMVIMQRISQIIQRRISYVDYWHKSIMVNEQSLPAEERLFTLFKISQKYGTNASHDILENQYTPLTNSNLDELLTKKVLHTRQVFEKAIPTFYVMMWAGIIALTILSVLL